MMMSDRRRGFDWRERERWRAHPHAPQREARASQRQAGCENKYNGCVKHDYASMSRVCGLLRAGGSAMDPWHTEKAPPFFLHVEIPRSLATPAPHNSRSQVEHNTIHSLYLLARVELAVACPFERERAHHIATLPFNAKPSPFQPSRGGARRRKGVGRVLHRRRRSAQSVRCRQNAG